MVILMGLFKAQTDDSHMVILMGLFKAQTDHAAPINSLSTSSRLQTGFTTGALPYGLIGIAASQTSPTLPPPASLTNTRRSDGLGTTVAVLCFVCLHISCISIQPPPSYTNTLYLVMTINPQRVSPHCHHYTTIHPINQQALLFLYIFLPSNFISLENKTSV